MRPGTGDRERRTPQPVHDRAFCRLPSQWCGFLRLHALRFVRAPGEITQLLRSASPVLATFWNALPTFFSRASTSSGVTPDANRAAAR